MKLSAAFLPLCISVSSLSEEIRNPLRCLHFIRRTAAYRLNLCYNKDFIESPDCIFEVIVAHAYDNIKLAGALVNHFYINMCVSKILPAVPLVDFMPRPTIAISARSDSSSI